MPPLLEPPVSPVPVDSVVPLDSVVVVATEVPVVPVDAAVVSPVEPPSEVESNELALLVAVLGGLAVDDV